jgi:outer membrane biosynthesis protein TonB
VNVRPSPKKSESKVKSTKKVVHTTHFEPKAQLKPEFIPQVVPGPGYLPDPYPDPHPIDPPGYISEPLITCIGPPDPLPKTIRDSIVNFPTMQASFGGSNDDLLKYIDNKINNSNEWNYLRELGIEGKIYIRLLIDVKGKVREVNFLKFSDKELEILKPRLITTLLTMPNWIVAKDENAAAVVSEFTFPIRVSFR